MSGDAVADAAKAACQRALAGLGLRKRAGTTYTFEVNQEVLGFLGLNVAANRPTGPFAVNPVVGARHQALEKEVAALTGEKASTYAPPTVSSPLGYLLPEGRFAEWEFPDAASADGVADGLAAAFRDHGLPFAQAHGTLEAVVEALASGDYGFPQQNAVRLPVGLALLGRVEEGHEAVQRELAALGERQDLAAQWLRSFGVRFEERFARA